MTISSTNRTAGPFTGTGLATVFPFAYKVFQAADLIVVRLEVSTGTETTLTLVSDYTVTLNQDQDASPGGSVVLLIALQTGFKLTLSSDIANLQATDLTNQGGFYPDVINDALDRATIQIQQMDDNITRSIKNPISDPLSLDMTLPTAANRANSFLAFDATGLPSIVTSGSTGAPATMVRQQFSGTGSQVAFTLASDPLALGNSMEVFIGGVYQQRSTYTVSGTTLTFSSAPVAGTDNIETINFLLTAIGTTDSSLVTYTPAGTGAVARTAQDKFRDTVSVKDFGAVADGVADDTAAIQLALNSGATSVYIPSICVVSTPTLTISTAGLRLFGGGLKKLTVTSVPILTVAANDVEIDGVEFIGASQNAVPAARVGGDTAINMFGNYSPNPYKNFTVKNCSINGLADVGIRIFYLKNMALLNNTISYCGYTGISVLSIENGLIDGNFITEIHRTTAGSNDNAYGIAISRDPAQTLANAIRPLNVIVSNNIVSNVYLWTGIDMHAAEKCKILDNVITNCKHGTYIQYDSSYRTYRTYGKDIEIARNLIVGQTATGTNGGTTFPSEYLQSLGIASLGLTSGYWIDPLLPLSNQNVWIHDNTLLRCGGDQGAIYITETVNCIVENNYIEQSVYSAIHVGASANETLKNVIVRNNTINGCARDASSSAVGLYFEVTSATANCIVENNKLYNSFRTSATATISIASPCVVTWTAHPLRVNSLVRFTTTGAVPTGLVAGGGAAYYVKTVLDANTFTLAATAGGAEIVTSGSQSGTHTVSDATYEFFFGLCYLNRDGLSYPLTGVVWSKNRVSDIYEVSRLLVNVSTTAYNNFNQLRFVLESESAQYTHTSAGVAAAVESVGDKTSSFRRVPGVVGSGGTSVNKVLLTKGDVVAGNCTHDIGRGTTDFNPYVFRYDGGNVSASIVFTNICHEIQGVYFDE